MGNFNKLSTPAFYDASDASKWNYRPDHAALFDAATLAAEKHAIKPSAADDRNIRLLLIDVQKDFSLPEGSLFVAGRGGSGAIEDNTRIAEFIYRNLPVLTNVTTTMDTHFAYQIFSPSFWIDKDGEPAKPFTVISADEVKAGDYLPNPAMAKWLCQGNYTWLRKQAEYYCSELERAGKYQLYLWPPHCILGSEGHVLAGVIHEARMFHSFARCVQSSVEVKGGNPLTENYSVLRPEVLTRHDGKPLAQRNALFLKNLMRSDAVVIAGQASSHCVKSTIDDLLDEIVSVDRNLAKKVFILTDCMSAVTVPDGNGGFAADFTADAEAAIARFEAAGMNIVKSTDDIGSWF
jgi:nicotinamidase-related amidase